MEILLAYEKYGTQPYASALAVVKSRAEDGYWYDDPSEYEWIINSNDEQAAESFLHSRSEYEYEGYEWVAVIE